ncbi:hypothetical protein NPIL_126761 [Nephila pilipes]|uniref:Uncharacterized protein n=1 Tax=Nephila pilipes TaxID=299642 RepID=A0A8X6UP03_NEPPI|nr:hypothetical protein NPIL_126761 [Nephila pilipes]
MKRNIHTSRIRARNLILDLSIVNTFADFVYLSEEKASLRGIQHPSKIPQGNRSQTISLSCSLYTNSRERGLEVNTGFLMLEGRYDDITPQKNAI